MRGLPDTDELAMNAAAVIGVDVHSAMPELPAAWGGRGDHEGVWWASPLEAAAFVAHTGMFIFPVGRNRSGLDKTPLRPWREWSSNDPFYVELFWPVEGAMVGIDCGASNIFVPDHDGMTPKDWPDPWKNPSGSLVRLSVNRAMPHEYFQQPEDPALRVGCFKLGPKGSEWGDVKGDGGFVVVSARPDNGCPIMPAPQIYFDLMAKYRTGGHGELVAPTRWASARFVGSITARLADVRVEKFDGELKRSDGFINTLALYLAEKATPGCRNDVMKDVVWWAMIELAAGLISDEVYPELLQTWLGLHDESSAKGEYEVAWRGAIEKYLGEDPTLMTAIAEKVADNDISWFRPEAGDGVVRLDEGYDKVIDVESVEVLNAADPASVASNGQATVQFEAADEARVTSEPPGATLAHPPGEGGGSDPSEGGTAESDTSGSAEPVGAGLTRWLAAQHPEVSTRVRVIAQGRLEYLVGDRLAKEYDQLLVPQAGAVQFGLNAEALARRAPRGGNFILDAPGIIPAYWGHRDEVLGAEGEGLMIAGQQGTGKTVIAQQLVLRRHGIRTGPLLGYPVKLELERPTVYFAMDRPRQAGRSWRRMAGEMNRTDLNRLVRIWTGPLPFDVRAHPQMLVEFAQYLEPNCGMIVIDSVKDLAPGVATDEVGSTLNSAFQHVIAGEIDLVLLHHQRKAGSGSERETNMDSIYGSTLMTSGLGSVFLVVGEPGDTHVEMRHVKQPATTVGPLKIQHDWARGDVSLHAPPTVYDILLAAPAGGLPAADIALAVHGDDDDATVKRVKRELTKLFGLDMAKVERGKHTGGGKTPDLWSAGIRRSST